MSTLEQFFHAYRKYVIGIEHRYETPYGWKNMIYADWTASGRLYTPIEKKMTEIVGPFMANTHTEASAAGEMMSNWYRHARRIIKTHVNADLEQDVLLTSGSGTTGVINVFQRILGLRVPESVRCQIRLKEEDRPLVIVTHMEHHSNHTSWLETTADVMVLKPDTDGNISLTNLKLLLEENRHRKLIIGAFTACSNVTGVSTPYYQMAKLLHTYNGLCFVDFAAAAPYVNINMHPEDPLERLDAIYFSPHKFLGGPGSCGVLLFDKKLYQNGIPDAVGGGTVKWTNPWGEKSYCDDIEEREHGGTPGILQVIRVALCLKLKEQMGLKSIHERENELLDIVFKGLKRNPHIHMLEPEKSARLGIISFYSETIHYNLFTKLLSDRFGIQARGGCSCAGTYGHYLLDIDKEFSKQITNRIDAGYMDVKPGWVRISLHPVMTNKEAHEIVHAISEVTQHYDSWKMDYEYDRNTNQFVHIGFQHSNDIYSFFAV
ncbi:aminotransferase class V-fold PLP-dependent enzyme [Paenibacillus roseipurpureus]|uniref:Aminotransferase class V-fold PLP-dependent enzyme n=1 Tax=Paenibacillus roseopurpureus TaxID=2918901 RepID=A0AA96RI93_9BACL|nr:aminotransferase class V-fold PLP-dependent enzyme [Paenibacillus sp. MBLB1832]WNR44103.1 aminotransferase class V-fold PLP-dependent enzyme [Paenibacillus sp. MBLB1832]